MMKQIMRINILNMVKNASQLQVDHEVPVNVISAILRTSQCAIMSHVTSAPEIRKGVFFAFFVSSLHLIHQELTSHSRGQYGWHTGPMCHI